MEQVVKHMTHWLLKKHLIVPEQSEWCHYMLMQSTMSILSLCLLLPVSAAIVGVWGSVFYTATFRILRQRTGGYHARTPHGCLLVSFVLQVLFSLLAAATKDLYVLTTVILLSEVAIFLLGPANHPELRQRIESGKTQNVCASSHYVFGLCCSATGASGDGCQLHCDGHLCGSSAFGGCAC